MQRYQITDDGMQEVAADGNIVVLQSVSDLEKERVVQKYNLPENTFDYESSAVEVSRFSKNFAKKEKDSALLTLMTIDTDRQGPVEKRLQPLMVIWFKEQLIINVPNDHNLVAKVYQKLHDEINSLEALIGFLIHDIFNDFIAELRSQKIKIDQLDKAARDTTEDEELFRLADTERDLVFLDQSLNDLHETLDHLWDETDILSAMEKGNVFEDIKLSERRAEKMVNVYRDLLETIGGLFSDMMDNNLNHLMKYLDSASLVIAVPSLVAGIWGMNTGGLPGKGSTLGFVLVMGLSVVLAVLTAMHLVRKDYSH